MDWRKFQLGYQTPGRAMQLFAVPLTPILVEADRSAISPLKSQPWIVSLFTTSPLLAATPSVSILVAHPDGE